MRSILDDFETKHDIMNAAPVELSASIKSELDELGLKKYFNYIKGDNKIYGGAANFKFARNMVTKSVPEKNLQLRTSHVDLAPGDRVIITSDGIHDNLTKKEIEDIINSNQDSDKAAAELVKAAKVRANTLNHEYREKHGLKKNIRAKFDDLTAIVINI